MAFIAHERDLTIRLPFLNKAGFKLYIVSNKKSKEQREAPESKHPYGTNKSLCKYDYDDEGDTHYAKFNRERVNNAKYFV